MKLEPEIVPLLKNGEPFLIDGEWEICRFCDDVVVPNNANYVFADGTGDVAICRSCQESGLHWLSGKIVPLEHAQEKTAS